MDYGLISYSQGESPVQYQANNIGQDTFQNNSLGTMHSHEVRRIL